MVNKNFFVLLLLCSICSCKKESTIADNNVIVSGKIKSVIKSYSRKSNIITIDYDSQNRVTNFNERTEDSSYTPLKITSARYTNYQYQNATIFPSKSITSFLDGTIDSALFFYDGNSKLVKKDEYHGGSLLTRTKYMYPSPSLIVAQDSGYAFGSFFYLGFDSLFLDNNGSITTFNTYNNIGNLNISYQTDFDNKKSPFYELNIFKYIYLIGDLDVGYNSKHNFTNFKRVGLGTADHTITLNYNYSANSFPLNAAGRETYNAALLGYTNITLQYNYY